MISLFTILAHIGTIIAIICGGLAVVAAFYVPPVIRHYVISALILLGGASQFYSEGYRQSENVWKTKWVQREREYSDNIHSIAEANQKAIVAAQEKVRAQEAANAAALKEQLEQETQDRQKAEAEAQEMRDRIAQAPKSADDAAQPLILDVIHGGHK